MPLRDVSIPQVWREHSLNLRYVAVDKLQEANTSLVSENVEGLRLDIGVIQSGPLQVLLGQLGVCRFASVLSNRLDGIRAILGLLGASNSGQTEDV
jgi:hypothetical protein